VLLCTCKLIGISDLMFGKHVSEPKKDDETHDQHEERTWQQKVRVTGDGQCYLQPFALKNCLESAARWLALKIPGERSKTYTKRFTSGILVVEKLLLSNGDGKPLTMDKVDPVSIFVPSDGKRGGPKRVPRIFPTIYAPWSTDAEIHIFDNKIVKDVLLRHLDAGGKFIGFGSMRVENGGINGRFSVENLEVNEIEA